MTTTTTTTKEECSEKESTGDKGQCAPLGFVCNHPSLCPICIEMCEVDDLTFPVFRHLLQGKLPMLSDNNEDNSGDTLDMLGSGMLMDKSEILSSSSTTATINPRVWVHLKCAEKLNLANKLSSSSATVCKHWRQKGYCSFQEKCHFEHPPNLCGVDKNEFYNKRSVSWGGRKKRQVRNTSRAWVFIKFLLENQLFDKLEDKDYTRSSIQSQDATANNANNGVLDIAGGSGEVAFQLVNLCNIPTTIVDPRIPNLTSSIRKFEKGMMHRNLSNRSFTIRSRKDGLVPLDCIPIYVDTCLLENIVSYSKSMNGHCDDGDNVDKIVQQIQARLDETGDEMKRLGQSNGKDLPIGDHVNNEKVVDGINEKEQQLKTSKYVPLARLNVNICQNSQMVLERFINCSLVVGMHPDQATEFIVDLALALNKPFAIVPCCVHSKIFPHRKCSKSGKLIRSYDDFLDYLQEKDGSIHRSTLDFDGRNVVLYRFAEK